MAATYKRPGQTGPFAGGKISTYASDGGTAQNLIDFKFRIEGVEKNSEAFKAIRKDINKRMRDVMVRVGEREVLPTLRSQLRYGGSSMYVKRERSGVLLGSRLKNVENRILGWMDMNGLSIGEAGMRRQNRRRTGGDTHGPREGDGVIFNTLEAKRTIIDQRVFDGVMKEFESKGFEVGK